MDFALPELLNREDIINIFNQRQLHVPNVNELPLEKLLRVFKAFAMPLSRRQERGKKMKQVTPSISATRNEDTEEQFMQFECSDSTSIDMDIDFVSAEANSTEHLRDTARTTSPAGEKRRQRCSDEDIFDVLKIDYQYQLSSVTKRIRINSVS